ncbi:heme exporter protein CcmB [Ferrimicrobium acidiphilum]|uniref:CcmB protein n=1 Tax=Ferrimicrobium acidiphilum DSM 19497 TaxID=1121877 RepID=A0A0D8FTV6_9ACTN|nr:heme exporter protein CcmB [Ferrimicrobium acidiphilum]KJE76379.1 CcmB protein [Ferrimicrobium acidiphilum DSM 19497]MCL5052573.1 heme exporter protein CcmB [Gammaproteobacteria bacterium]
MLRTAVVMAKKDLRLEWRARVLLNQVLPFVFVVIVLFAFGFDAKVEILTQVTPGLFWVTTFFGLELAITRAMAIEGENQAQVGLVMMGVNPRGIFLGKVVAIVLEILVLEVVLSAGIAVLFNSPLHDVALLAGSALLADVGVATVGIVLAGVTEGLGGSLLPLLLFPVVSPVLLCATKVWQYGLDQTAVKAIPWSELLIGFSLIYLVVGILVYGVVLEG